MALEQTEPNYELNRRASYVADDLKRWKIALVHAIYRKDWARARQLSDLISERVREFEESETS